MPEKFYQNFAIDAISCQLQGDQRICNVTSLIEFTEDIDFYDQLSEPNDLSGAYGLNNLIDFLMSNPLLDKGISLNLTSLPNAIDESERKQPTPEKSSLLTLGFSVQAPTNVSQDLLKYQLAS